MSEEQLKMRVSELEHQLGIKQNDLRRALLRASGRSVHIADVGQADPVAVAVNDLLA